MARRSSRTRLQQIGLTVIVGLIALAFVLVFGQPSAGPGPDVVAEVNGETVNRDIFEFFRRQIEQSQRPFLPPGADDQAFQEQLDLITVEGLLQRWVMAQEARALGLRVSEEEIRQEICRQPFFQRDGRCDGELYERFLASYRLSDRSYSDALRRELLVRKLTRLLTSPIRVSEGAVADRLRRDRLELRLRYVAARREDFLDRASVGPEEAAAFAEAEPERLALAYERRRDEFQQPEEVRARHILFTGEGALERAQEARARIEAGEDFVVLATRLSQDEATRDQGGELGFFPRGRGVVIEEAAFGAPERTLVGPVETERGQHLIRVEERRPGVDRSLEEVALELATGLIQQDRARDLAREAADLMSARLRAGARFDEAAQAAGLAIDETILFRAAEPLVPGIGRLPGLSQTAAALTPENPDSARIFGSDGPFYLISLAERREPDLEALAAELGPAREQTLARARSLVMDTWYRQEREALEQSGRLWRFPLYARN